jgi:hypothetical protein
LNEHDFLELRTKVDEQTAANKAEHDSFKRRLNSLEEAGKERTEMLLAIQRIGDAQETVVEKVAGIATSVEGVEKRLDEIEKEPGDNAKKLAFEIVKYIVLAIVGVIVGYFIK